MKKLTIILTISAALAGCNPCDERALVTVGDGPDIAVRPVFSPQADVETVTPAPKSLLDLPAVQIPAAGGLVVP